MERGFTETDSTLRTFAAKRPASPTLDCTGTRDQKRVKDTPAANEEYPIMLQPVPVKPAPARAKRALEDDADGPPEGGLKLAVSVGDAPRGHAGRSGGSQRVLQASELENSIAGITVALRWRSPVKPHKLPRLHGGGPSSPARGPHRTAVRGIVDVGADDEEDPQPGTSCHQHHHPQQQKQHQPQQPERGDGGASVRQQGHGGSSVAGPEAQGQQQQLHPNQQQHHHHQHQQQEWGQLFGALSLGGAGRGSQRTDPVWAAVSSNRQGASSSGPGARCGQAAVQDAGAKQDAARPVGGGGGSSAVPAQAPGGGVAAGSNSTSTTANSVLGCSVEGGCELAASPVRKPSGAAPPSVVSGTMDISPVKGVVAEAENGWGAAAHAGLAGTVEPHHQLLHLRGRPHSRGSGSGGGFLAQEASRLMSMGSQF